MMAEPATPPVVWLLTDDKPGHRNQLRGLAQRLQALTDATCHWVSVGDRPVSLLTVLRGTNLAATLPPPALAIAAGSGTQRALLATRRHFGCRSALLMKPNFPYSWLDAAIVPLHDQPPTRPNVLATRGVINAITPGSPRTAQRGLLLIGGISKHFGWDSGAVIAQVLTLCHESPDWQWTLTDSRRTPADFMPALRAQAPANLTVVAHTDTTPDWLPTQLAASGRIWATPDSVSMVYEAITSGAPTGLLELPDPRAGRILAGLQQLLADGLATPFTRRAAIGTAWPQPPLWEADRAARWLLQRLFPQLPVSPLPVPPYRAREITP